MISRRRVALGLGAGAFAPLATLAQQRPVKWRIGVLQLSSKEFFVQGGYQQEFLAGMRERGYVLGTDFVLDERFADGDVARLPMLAAELARIPVDLILTSGTQANRATQQATTTIPVVTVAEADPVGNGLAVTLARPGKNITGLSTLFGDTIIKNVELLAAIVPKLTRLAVLANPSNQGSHAQLAAIRSVASTGGFVVVPFDAASANDIARAIERAQREKAQALLVLPDSIFSSLMDVIARLTLKHGLPSSYVQDRYAEAGGLMSYGRDNVVNWRLGTGFIDRIFKGARPGDLPFEQPSVFQLVLNMRTAQTLGVKIPQAILVQATKVIE
jgi:putative ABC transport system substrate-binding protein